MIDFSKLDLRAISVTPEKPRPRCVVRVRTSYWYDNNGIHMRKDITFLKRRSFESDDLLGYEASMSGADEVFPRITNLDEVKDGIYEVDTCNHSRDWETGYLDDYDFVLKPYLVSAEKRGQK